MWNKKREGGTGNPPFARELMPMGAVTYAIACSHCKNRNNRNEDKCHRCKCEIESGFEIDPATCMQWIPVTERLPDWRNGKVLVFTKYGFSICERTVNGRWKGQHANWITHWMPLPEPPKEVE